MPTPMRRLGRHFRRALPLLFVSPAAWAASAFEPSLFVSGVTLAFAVATLVTGTAALLANWGVSLLVATGTFVPEEGGEPVVAPNVRGWGARQVATGFVLWAALLLGDQVLFQVGLAGLLFRQALDIVANALDGTYPAIGAYVVAAIPTAAALLATL